MQTISRELLQTPEQKIARIEVIVGQQPEVAGFQSYEYFANTAVEQRDKFISGEISHPEMVYPELNREKVRELASAMQEATKDLLPGEKKQKSNSSL